MMKQWMARAVLGRTSVDATPDPAIGRTPHSKPTGGGS